jgi:hypothetical protein
MCTYSSLWQIYAKTSNIHIVTIKFLTCCYYKYSNTTNAIYWGWMGLDRENVFYMMYKFELVCLMHMKITVVLEMLVFSSCRRFQKGTKSRNQFLCEVKETAYWNVWNVGKWVRRRMFIENVCLNGIKGSEKGSKSENAKFSGENNVDCIFLC